MAEDKSSKASPEKDEKVAQSDDDFLIKDSTTEEAESKETKKSGEPSAKELEQAMTEAEAEATQPTEKLQKPKQKHVWSRKKIILVVVAAVVVLIGALAAIPMTRYAIAGLVIKKDVSVTLKDSKTGKPVSKAAVEIDGKSSLSDANGAATFKSVSVGSKKITASKKYYKSQTSEMTVGIGGANPSFTIDIQATGRQVPIKVVNKISKQAVEGAEITVEGTSSKTDKNGEAVVVLPADKTELDATLSLQGYNNQSAKITITEQQDDKNTFSITPSGTLFFLSKRSGTIDVLKSDLDGGNVQTVLKGTGKEDGGDTILLASRDWKYLALKSHRDGDRAKLYLIEAASGKLSVIDEGNVDFLPVGWYDSHFIYNVSRGNNKLWEAKHNSLKSYNATTGTLAVLDETAASGDNAANYAYETIANPYILDGEIVYVKDWSASPVAQFNGKSLSVMSVKADGSGKKVVKSFAEGDGVYFGAIVLSEPNEIYYTLYQKYQPSFWEYEGGKFEEKKDITAEDFYQKFYATYLLSPSGKNTFWFEPRDGKNTLIIGDQNGQNGKEIATLSEYSPYGWYGDDYLLVSKNSSELFIMARSHPEALLKITDYHKPGVNFSGYGYGYGGL